MAGSGTAALHIGSIIRIGEPILGWVVQHNEPVLLNGALSDDDRFRASEAARRKSHPVSSMCWPLTRTRECLALSA
ncbi:MAG: hypothetical protein ACE5ET_00495 [Gammaproteobacteria bacterium]